MKQSNHEILSIYVNLLKTTMGCGILNYPFLVLEFGIISSIFLTFISAFSSYAGILLYIELNARFGRNNTLSTVTRHFMPCLKYLADIVVIFKCYTVSIAYLVYIKCQINFLIQYYNLNVNLYFVFFVVILFIAPFIFMTKLDKLKYTSSFGLIAILLLISTSYYRYITLTNLPNLIYFRKSHNYIENLSSFVFSFTCHQNIFTLQNEMKFYNTQKFKLTALCSFISASIIYLLFGIISYMAFGNQIVKPFINTHPNDTVKAALSWFYILLLGLSVPLQTNPCKQYLLNMINEKILKNKEYKYVRAFTSFLIISSCFGLACTNIDFDKMCKFIGGTFSTLMCFIFASLYYFINIKVIGSSLNTALAVISITYGMLSFYSVIKIN
ncbi:hypothetical protein NCER_101191 [Vairimorpha ceranae BRL01]|uniref:Amino acid transporter transmembrane domain-containing protein n=2 Tax=Vairimorpha ceranae TaxID=40302 RepID=C4V9F2_VAIC1|nr:aminoacid transporter [Vairimorpha ceranae]EEQ82148.1 hypothetical protein NCER_101191 [Vairimorpha ceranae BRL01]KKO74112.1 aminoacid transporter [Vairimorpha ceranae]